MITVFPRGISSGPVSAVSRRWPAVRDADIVITMLPTAGIVTAVVFDDAVIDAFTSGAMWAQMGTIGAPETTELASRLRGSAQM